MQGRAQSEVYAACGYGSTGVGATSEGTRLVRSDAPLENVAFKAIAADVDNSRAVLQPSSWPRCSFQGLNMDGLLS